MITPLPVKRNADGRSRSISTINSAVSSTIRSSNGSNGPVRRGLRFDSGNEEPPHAQYVTNENEGPDTTTIPLHPHESSRDYLLRIHERGDNGSREQWMGRLSGDSQI